MTKPLGEEAVKLLPCPFCGGDGQIQPMGPRAEGFFAVSCSSPGCFVLNADFWGEAAAIAAWNRRPQPQGACVQVEGLSCACRPPCNACRVVCAKYYAQVEAERDDLDRKLGDAEAGYHDIRGHYQAALHQRDAARKALEEIAKFNKSRSRAASGSYQKGYDTGFDNAGSYAANIARQALSELKDVEKYS